MTKILIAQSFVVDGPGSYWDYRDYLFCLCSNLCVKNQTFRLNIERGSEWINEFRGAAEKHRFSKFTITATVPVDWRAFMLEQVEEVPSTWVMPWPGDHIYKF